VLNVVRYSVELNCPADSIPDSIEVDLAEVNMGDSVHISDITLPDGVVPVISDRDFTIATIAVPAGGASDDSESDGEEGDKETSEDAATEDEDGGDA
jgi:large subunit ribosomal protein L25